MLRKFEFLQFFADDANDSETENNETTNNADNDETGTNENNDSKTFTQEELNKAIKELKENLEAFKKEQSFKDLSDEEREKKQAELETEQLRKKVEETEKELQEYRRKNRNSEILQEYNKDKLPRADLFVKVAPLIASVEDEQARLEVYNGFVEYVKTILSDQKKELYKGQTPNGSSGVDGKNNPFASQNKNYTEIAKLIKTKPQEAKVLAQEAGVYSKFKELFKN